MLSRGAAGVALTVALVPTARAADVDFEGFYRARARAFSSLSIDPLNGDSEGLSQYIQHRAVLRPRFVVNDQIAFFMDIRALDGVTWGDRPTPITDISGQVDPMVFTDQLEPAVDGNDGRAGLSVWRAWSELRFGDHTVRVGRMPLNWGRGVWWNDGLGLVSDYGDSADRVQWEGLFDEVYASVAVDVSHSGFWGAQDDTYAVNGMIAYRDETINAGLAGQIKVTPNPSVSVFTADASMDATIGLIDVSAEIVAHFGGGDLDTGATNVRIASGGGVVEGGVGFDWATVSLIAGLATGDQDPNDATQSTFAFDPDYNVGVLLFEQALPTFAATLPTSDNGGRDASRAVLGTRIQNAIFLRPSIRRTFADKVEVEGSLLYARAAAVPSTTAYSGRRTYGYELDASARWVGTEHVDLALTGAVFLPGDWFTNYADIPDLSRPVLGAQLTGRVRF